MLELRDDYPVCMGEGEKLLHVFTGNVMDEVYAVTDLEGDELEYAIRTALRRRYGRHYGYDGYEDVTDDYELRERARAEAHEEWRGPGWYDIGWSDGGTYGEPSLYGDEEGLAADMWSAWCESTETHLPYSEYLWDGEMPPRTAELWNQGLSAYLDGMTEIEYARIGDEGRTAIERLAEALEAEAEVPEALIDAVYAER